MTDNEAADQAERGATLLDKKKQDWALGLKPPHPAHATIFDVVFEIYGNHTSGLTKLGIAPDSEQERSHGFKWLQLEEYEAQEDPPNPRYEDTDDPDAQTEAHYRWVRDCYRLHSAWYDEITSRQRVARGADRLDGDRPSWAIKLDPPAPDHGMPFDVLSALYPSHERGLKALGIEPGSDAERNNGFATAPAAEDRSVWWSTHGFYCLSKAWYAAIAIRKP